MHLLRLWLPYLYLLLSVLGFLPVAYAAPPVTFDSPEQNARLAALPATVSFRFSEPVIVNTIRVSINNNDVTTKFKLDASGGSGSLSAADGVRPNLGKNGQVSAPNLVRVFARTAAGTTVNGVQHFFVLAAANPNQANVVVPSGGGTVSLPNYGSFTFPAGSFASNQPMTLLADSSAETAQDWDTTSTIFAAQMRAAYEIKLNSGATRTAQPFTATLRVPADLIAALPADGELKLFAQFFEDGGQEVLDSFEYVDSTFDGTNLTATLPPEVFTNRRRADGSYEAVLVIGVLNTKVSTTASTTLRAAAAETALPVPKDAQVSMGPLPTNRLAAAATASGSCQGGALGKPLDNLEVTGAFNPPSHYGTDYRAADGTQVKAMADGKIVTVGFDERPLATPDPRSGKTVKGWGRYVVIEHTDGSRTLYAHLQTNGVSVNVGDQVARGQSIGASDNSGGSQAPHLHVEYAPNGRIYNKPSKADPNACINLTTGSVTIRDNGSAADDAFALSINGFEVCRTTIGAANTCAVGALRSGTAQMSLQCTIAPDNVGTYELTVGGGITFSDGTTIRSGTLPEGGIATFNVTVP